MEKYQGNYFSSSEEGRAVRSSYSAVPPMWSSSDAAPNVLSEPERGLPTGYYQATGSKMSLATVSKIAHRAPGGDS